MTCKTCEGSWVTNAAIDSGVAAAQGRKRARLEWKDDQRAPLPCPECRGPMAAKLLFDVAVERCDAHGVWFDRATLAEVVRNSRPPETEHVAKSALDVILHLFWTY